MTPAWVGLLVIVASFPAFPHPKEAPFTLIAPADGSVLSAGLEGHANLTLRYHLSAPGATRLCLNLRRAALQYYRGPLVRRADDATLVPYARGCYTPGQPVTLQQLSVGSYALEAVVEDERGGHLDDASCVFAVSRTLNDASAASGDAQPALVPTYEWQVVAAGQSIPSGLEVKMTLHESHSQEEARLSDGAGTSNPPTLARIPPVWRLQVYVGHGFGFARQDVLRTTSIRSVEEAMRRSLVLRHGESCAPHPQLWVGSERLAPSETAEQVNLFARRQSNGLAVKLVPCTNEGDEDVEGRKEDSARTGEASHAEGGSEEGTAGVEHRVEGVETGARGGSGGGGRADAAGHHLALAVVEGPAKDQR